MRSLHLASIASLVALYALGGCSLSRGGHTDRSVLPVQPAPARAWVRTSDERVAVHGLTVRRTDGTPRTAVESIDPRALALAFPSPVAAPEREDPDPIRSIFDALPTGHRWMPAEFLPAGGTLDLTRVGRSRLHLRAWNQDEDFRGGGVGVTVPLRSGWHAAAELGVNPMRSPDAGGFAVVAGFGLRL